MRLKEANNKIAHIAWSPSTTYPSYIASGTAAEQFDSSFSTKSSLDLLKLRNVKCQEPHYWRL